MSDPLFQDYIKSEFENWMWKKHPIYQVVTGLLGLILLVGGVFSVVAIFFFTWWWKLMIALLVIAILGRIGFPPIEKDYFIAFIKERKKS